jgi:hypothetical protein
LDVGDDAKPPLQGGSLGATPQGNPLNIDPLLETTPPPGKPRDTFGIGTAPEYEELGSPQLGQTLIVYHPFAGHPPEIVNTANLTWTREFDLPPHQKSHGPHSKLVLILNRLNSSFITTAQTP